MPVLYAVAMPAHVVSCTHAPRPAACAPLQASLDAEIEALEAAVAEAAAAVPPLQQDVEVVREAMQEQRSSFHELRGSHQVRLEGLMQSGLPQWISAIALEAVPSIFCST